MIRGIPRSRGGPIPESLSVSFLTQILPAIALVVATRWATLGEGALATDEPACVGRAVSVASDGRSGHRDEGSDRDDLAYSGLAEDCEGADDVHPQPVLAIDLPVSAWPAGPASFPASSLSSRPLDSPRFLHLLRLRC